MSVMLVVGLDFVVVVVVFWWAHVWSCDYQKFFGCIDNQILLPMVLRCVHFARVRAPPTISLHYRPKLVIRALRICLIPFFSYRLMKSRRSEGSVAWEDRKAVDVHIQERSFNSFADDMIIVSSQKKWTGLLARFLRLWLKYWFQAWKVAGTFEKQASSHEPGWTGWPGCWDKFRLGFIREISVRFLRGEMAKDPGHVLWCQIRETKQTWWNTKIITFAPIIASATLKAVSLQLNGCLRCEKIQQAIQDDAIRTARIHPAFILVTGLKFSYGKISSALTEIPVEKNRGLGNWASQPSHMNTLKILPRI